MFDMKIRQYYVLLFNLSPGPVWSFCCYIKWMSFYIKPRCASSLINIHLNTISFYLFLSYLLCRCITLLGSFQYMYTVREVFFNRFQRTLLKLIESFLSPFNPFYCLKGMYTYFKVTLKVNVHHFRKLEGALIATSFHHWY